MAGFLLRLLRQWNLEHKFEVVENIRSWPCSGLSDDKAMFLPTGDQAGIQHLKI